MTAYRTAKNGEWIQPTPRGFLSCCHCGLVHRVQFRVVEGRVQFRAWRAPRKTAQRRKAMGS